MRENFRRNFHSHTDIHTVGFGGNFQMLAYLLHPFTAATAYGNNAVRAAIAGIRADHLIAAVCRGNGQNRRIKEKPLGL